jgi:Flp pilus assembly protein CpaB
MAKRSNVLLILGLAVFILGGAVVILVTRDGGGTPAGESTGPAQVLVATQDLAAGTSGADIVAGGMVALRPLPPGQQRAADALVSTADLTNRVLATDVRAGQPLTASALRPLTLRRDAIKIPEGKQAVAVKLPFVPAVAGYVGPGDTVNVYANVKGAGEPVTKLVLANVEVLDVSQEVAPRRTTSDPNNVRPTGTEITYLLALDATQAEKVIFLAANESLYLTLVPKGQPPAVTPGSSYRNLF